MHFYFRLLNELALAIFLVANSQANCQSNKGMNDFTLYARANESDVQLSWTKVSSQFLKEIQIYRSKDGKELEFYRTLTGNTNNFTDSLAVFGKYSYRVKVSLADEVIWSNIVFAEIYFGNDFSELFPLGGVHAGHQYSLVFGNAQKNDSIWYALLNSKGDYLESFTKKSLEGQKFILPTIGLDPGTYVAFFKLDDFSLITYKFIIR